MSFSYSAVTTIGVRLEKSDLRSYKPSIQYFGCEHYPIRSKSNPKFCGDCGTELRVVKRQTSQWKEFVQDTCDLEFNDPKYDTEPQLTIGKLVVRTTGEGEPCYYLGVHADGGDYRHGGGNQTWMPEAAISITKAKLKETLEPLGLWKEKDFGIYTWCEVR